MESKKIDWEQRRYELAKAAMQGYCSNSSSKVPILMKSYIAYWSIEQADELIKCLQEESPQHST